jgi:signal peptidase I
MEEVTQAAKTDAGGKEDDDEPLLKEWVGLLVRAGCWALLIYLFIFQVSVVDGPSMEPTFNNGDRLVIDKLTYRFSNPERFDIIVFETVDRDKLPRMPRDYIKRVIGLPNEVVEFHDGVVWVRQSPGAPAERLQEPYGITDAETLGGNARGQSFLIPSGYYLVLGDNRSGSKDSRVKQGPGGSYGNAHYETLGLVPAGQIKGVVRLRLWPWKRWTWFSRGVEQTTVRE